MIRVVLPPHLRTLAGTGKEVEFEIEGDVTASSIVDALEVAYPNLKGTIRDIQTKKRRPMVRFFACEKDLSHDAPGTPLPERVTSGEEPFIILGAISGG